MHAAPPARSLALLCLGLALLVPRDGAAYTIETNITDGCHESIAVAALRDARSHGLGLPLPYTQDDDAAIVGDVPFSPPDDMKDLGGIAFLLGIRSNDVADLAATSLEELAQITSDPTTQRQHCLRSTEDKEPTGTVHAIATCRSFIHDELMKALGGLGADGTPDPNLREPLRVWLNIRGQYTVNMPIFYLHAGMALHAIQDSFTHAFRKPADPHVVTVDLNWIDYADGSLDEATEGPPHMKELDRCDDPDALRAERHRLAIEASSAALAIALDSTSSPDAKSAAFDHVLDTYLAVDANAGCSAANNWCDAPENQYRPSACACDAPGARGGGIEAIALAAIVAWAAARRRRSRAPACASILGAAIVLAPGGARADDAPHGPMSAINGESAAGTPGHEDPTGSFFGHVAIGASYDHPALSATGGVRYQIADRWMVGFDGEWNPWIPTQPLGFRPGAANAYGTVIRRFQMKSESVNIRTSASLGASVLLIDLPGAKKWSFGPLFGISFIGVELKMHPGWFLVVDPTYIVFDVPHLNGIPLGYYQYRFQVGLEFGG